MTRTEIWLTEMMCHFKSIDDMYRYYEHLVSLPNCNTCKRKNCEHKPKFGEDVRFNCFAYTDEEPKVEPQSIIGESFPSYITEDRTTQVLDGWQAHPRTSTTAVEDEPQTCSVTGRPYSECGSCEHFKCTADETQTDCPWK